MLAKIQSSAVVGLSALPVQVEVDVSAGLPGTTVVGLPNTTVRESKERIRSALKHASLNWPQSRVTVNLAPANLKKEGAAFDLPIALGVLVASGQLEQKVCEHAVFLGELALDGAVRAVPGVLAVALSLRDQGVRLFVPKVNAAEAALVENLEVIPVEHLVQIVQHLKGEVGLPALPLKAESAQQTLPECDFAEVRGQRLAKRAIEIAAAGAHNLLFLGPPGAGKTMLAERIPTILPELSYEESLETTLVHSVAGKLPAAGLVQQRPFRSVHHTVSEAGLVGGGSIPKPGELSLAHHGVLFLDELPEFNRSVLETLRQPLESGTITVTRAAGGVTFPAKTMVVASMNPCPCGMRGDAQQACLCSMSQILKYRSKISGPLLDRMDLHLQLSAVPVKDLSAPMAAEPSEAIRARVAQARQKQYQRFAETPIFTNAQMSNAHLKRWCVLAPEAQRCLELAMEKMHLSARAYHKTIKIARTIADLESVEPIQKKHIQEAVQYRCLDRATALG